MPRIVQKFGGTSVANIEAVRSMAKKVKAEVKHGNEVVVVVSAMAGTTNELVSWANQGGSVQDTPEFDTVVAAGEQITAGLLAMALQETGVDARSWLGWQIPIQTDNSHGKARILGIEIKELEEQIKEGEVAVIAGFQGLG